EKGEDHSVAVHTIVLKSGRLSDKQQTDLFAGFKPDEMQLAREALTTLSVFALDDMPNKQLHDGSVTSIVCMLINHQRGRLILPSLDKLWDNFKSLKESPQGQEFAETVLTYAFLAGRENEKRGIIEKIGKHLGEQEEGNAMTVASALKREGRQEGEKLGMQKGKKEGLETAAVGMLNKGITTKDVIEITHLSPKRIAQLKAELKRQTGSSG
ncbi:MAG: hypothetical protein AAF443_08985, partial [Chlamydiota bacterium]